MLYNLKGRLDGLSPPRSGSRPDQSVWDMQRTKWQSVYLQRTGVDVCFQGSARIF